MSSTGPAENLLAAIHEERIQQAEGRVADLEASQRAHEETDALRFDQIANKIDDLGSAIIDKIDAVQDDVSHLKRQTAQQESRISELKAGELSRKKAKAMLWKLVWPAIAVLSGAFGHHLLEIWRKL